MRRRLRARAAKLALLAGSLAAALLAGEGLVRLVAPQQLIRLRPDVWQPVDGLSHRLAPRLDVLVNTGERTVRLLTDERGHRVGATRVAAPAWRVLALGDSFLEALQVEMEDALTARLERLLAARLGHGGEVVDAAVAGWDPNHYRIEAEIELERGGYDAVVVFPYLGNDVVPRRIDRFPAAQPARRHPFRRPRGLDRRELVDALLFPLNDALETRSHLFVLAKNRGKFLLMRLGLSRFYLPADVRVSERASPAWEVTTAIAAEIRDLAAARGVDTLFVFLPGLYQVDAATTARYLDALEVDPAEVDLDQPSRLLGERFAAAGLPFLDVTPALRAAHAAGVTELFGRVDTHLGREGHRVVAEAVAPAVLATLRGRRPDLGRSAAEEP